MIEQVSHDLKRYSLNSKFIVIIIVSGDKHVWIVLSLVILPIFLWLVSVCLWIAVGGVVGPQISKNDIQLQ